MTKTSRAALISSIILLLIFVTTDPQRLPSVMLVAPFLLLFVILSATTAYLFGAYGITKQKRLRIALIGASVPVMLLVLQSLGQLTVRDTLAIFALFAVACFYMSRLGIQTTN